MEIWRTRDNPYQFVALSSFKHCNMVDMVGFGNTQEGKTKHRLSICCLMTLPPPPTHAMNTRTHTRVHTLLTHSLTHSHVYTFHTLPNKSKVQALSLFSFPLELF